MRQLDPSELRPGLENPLTVTRLADPEIKVVVNGSLAAAIAAVLRALLRIATRAE
jgi:hypothetical protein